MALQDGSVAGPSSPSSSASPPRKGKGAWKGGSKKVKEDLLGLQSLPNQKLVAKQPGKIYNACDAEASDQSLQKEAKGLLA